MNETMQIVLSVMVCVSFVGVVTLIVLVHRRLRTSAVNVPPASIDSSEAVPPTSAKPHEVVPAPSVEPHEVEVAQPQPPVQVRRPLDSVTTRLSFAESFDPERFAVASYETAMAQVNSGLQGSAADGVTITVNGIRLTQSGAEMIVSASKGGQEMLKDGRAALAWHAESRSYLPQLHDVQTGKYIENMKGVPTKHVMSKVASASAVIVGAAHIISGADIAKRLKIIDRKIDLLLACRRIDQLAKLERIYTSAKELGVGSITQKKCWELWRLRGELRELRCAWRRELQHHLSLIEDPNSRSWLKKTFSRVKTTDRNTHVKITEGQLQLVLIDYSMRLDQVLAVGSGTVREFEATLADELEELSNVADTLRDKAKYISKDNPELSVEPTVQAMDQIVEAFQQVLLPELFESEAATSSAN